MDLPYTGGTSRLLTPGPSDARNRPMQNNFLKRFGYIIEYLLLVILILIVWNVMAGAGKLNPVIMPSPEKIVKTAWKLISNGSLLKNAFISLTRVLKGYLLAAALGILLGILIGLSRHLERITQLLFQIIKPIPPIAWIPLVILWFGIGESGKVFLIFLGGFFTILTNVVDGIRQADVKLIEVSRVMETPFLKQILRLVIPGEKIVVAYQFILQPGFFVCNVLFHLSFLR